MPATDRRLMLRLALLAAAAPALFAAGAWPGARASTPGPITPPAQVMRFRRSTRRPLPGGAHIAVTRDFGITFRAAGTGFVIDGRQIAVTTDFPPGLERFAHLEAARSDDATFPLVVDGSGQIVSTSQQADADQPLRAAIAEALARIRAQPLGPDQRQQLLGFVETLHQAGSAIIAQMPPDLFAPLENERSETRHLALPNGETGEVSSRFVAERDPATGLMRRASRQISTRIASEARHTDEEWSLGLL